MKKFIVMKGVEYGGSLYATERQALTAMILDHINPIRVTDRAVLKSLEMHGILHPTVEAAIAHAEERDDIQPGETDEATIVDEADIRRAREKSRERWEERARREVKA